jgi:hypothetical protein
MEFHMSLSDANEMAASVADAIAAVDENGMVFVKLQDQFQNMCIKISFGPPGAVVVEMAE